MVHFHSTTGAATNTVRPNHLGSTPQKPTSSTFQQQLADVGFSSFQNLFGGSSASTVSTTASASVHPTSGLPGSSPTATVSPASVTTSPAVAQPKLGTALPIDQTDPVTMLQSAMVAEGMDPSQVRMSYQSQNVQYPGGSYTLNQVKCQFNSGRVLFIDADAMKVNPDIAALDVKWVEQHPTLS